MHVTTKKFPPESSVAPQQPIQEPGVQPCLEEAQAFVQQPHSRREILRAGVGLAAGALLAGHDAWAKPARLPRPKIPHLSNIKDAGGMIRGQGMNYPGHVVQIHHRNAYPNSVYPVKAAAATKMMNAFIMRLTGKSSLREAWGRFFGPGDRVGILVDPVGTAQTRTRTPLINAIVAGLLHAGLKHNQIAVWAPHGKHLAFLGYNLNWSNRGVRVVGADQMGYDQRYKYNLQTGLFGSACYVSKLVSQWCTHIINLATLEDHPVLGCRLALAQEVLSSFSSSQNLARHWGGPHIGAAAANPVLRKRFTLHIIDGLAGSYNGANGIWHPQLLFGGTDPVAVDRVGFSLIDAKRREASLTQISAQRNSPRFINAAALNGLGVANIMNIKHRKYTIR